MLIKYRSTSLVSSTTLTISDVDAVVQEKCSIISSRTVANLGARVTGQLANLKSKFKCLLDKSGDVTSSHIMSATRVLHLTHSHDISHKSFSPWMCLELYILSCHDDVSPDSVASRAARVFSSQQGYEILFLSRATFSARCTRKWTRWRHVRCLRPFVVSTGCVLKTASASFHRCSCKFHIFRENNHLSSYRKERRVLEVMTNRERETKVD